MQFWAEQGSSLRRGLASTGGGVWGLIHPDPRVPKRGHRVVTSEPHPVSFPWKIDTPTYTMSTP